MAFWLLHDFRAIVLHTFGVWVLEQHAMLELIVRWHDWLPELQVPLAGALRPQRMDTEDCIEGS